MEQHRRVATILTLCAAAFWTAFQAGCDRSTPPPRQPKYFSKPKQDSSFERFPAIGIKSRPIRAIWIARMHYRYQDDIATIMRNCAALGANTVFWQVRGNGTVAYPSQYEPWSREFGYKNPGFDPLAVAIKEAKANGLRIEAWINVMPGWRGVKPPPITNQLHHQHPEWFLHNDRGVRQPLNENYVILNPCLPEVRKHIVSICRELLDNYQLDGLHLDYVRYAWDTTPNAKKAYPRDVRTVSLFRQQTGKSPDADIRTWNRWRANQITHLVTEIRATVDVHRPGASLTAAVVQNPDVAYESFLQDAVRWLNADIVDAVFPMAYTENTKLFQKNINAYQSRAKGKRIVPGIGLYKHAAAKELTRQFQLCRTWGRDVAVFSYDSIHPTHQDRLNKKEPQKKQNERIIRRQVVREAFGQR